MTLSLRVNYNHDECFYRAGKNIQTKNLSCCGKQACFFFNKNRKGRRKKKGV